MRIGHQFSCLVSVISTIHCFRLGFKTTIHTFSCTTINSGSGSTKCVYMCK